MYRGHTVGVVVPAYNEEERVSDVLDALPSFVDRVYAVDDCSTDGTWERICEYAAVDGGETAVDDQPDVRGETAVESAIADGGTAETDDVVAVRHTTNRGAGGALKTGYRHAQYDEMDVTVTIDADGQMDPSYMDQLLDPIVEGKAGYAKGNRLADRESRKEMPTFRLLGNCILTYLTKIASGYRRIQDPQNGYTAISYDALSSVDIDAIPNDHDYCNALLTRLNVADVRVADVSMPAVYGDEESTISYESFVTQTSVTLARSFCWRLRQRYLTSDDGGLSPTSLLGVLAGATGAGVLAGTTADETDGVGRFVRAIVAGGLLAFAAVVGVGDDEREVIRE